MSFQAIENRCVREIAEYADKKTEDIIAEVALQVGVKVDGFYRDDEFHKAVTPLRAYLRQKIERSTTHALWSHAEKAAIDVVKAALNDNKPAGQ